MSYRTKLGGLACGFLLLLVRQAAAQSEENVYVPAVRDVQLFAPAELGGYEYTPDRGQGWWGSWEFLHWSLSAPERTVIGAPGFHPQVFDGQSFYLQQSTADTGFIESEFEAGQRVEFGIMDDSVGWMFSGFRMTSNNQDFFGSNVPVAFLPDFNLGVSSLEGFADFAVGSGAEPNDPPPGDGIDDDLNGNNIYGRDGEDLGTDDGSGGFDLPFDGVPDEVAPTDFGDLATFPVSFAHLHARTHSTLWGLEVMCGRRLIHFKKGGVLEMYAGVRYLNFEDDFTVTGTGEESLPADDTDTTLDPVRLGILDNSQWFTSAMNNIVGPQLALRWYRRTGRWTWSTEGRFVAGCNFQSISQQGYLADRAVTGGVNAPLNLQPISFYHEYNDEVWAPVGELRFETSYQLFRSVALTAGWTGLFADSIARSSNMVSYSMPAMGILSAQNEQDIFVNGFNCGIEINR